MKKQNCSSHFSILKSTGIVFAMALAALTARAQEPTTYVYVESNIGSVPNQNSVFAFSNDGSGNLTSLAGSPYLTGGTGVFDTGESPSEFDADQQVHATSDGSLLYAVNGHSNTIAGFSINSDGTLTTVPGSPFPSGGQDPVSVGIATSPGPDTLVVVNKNEDPAQNASADLANYTSFSIGSDGALTMKPGATWDLVAGCSPSQALISAKGHFLFGIEFLSSFLTSYHIKSDGTMTQVSRLAPPENGGGHFLGGAINPKARIVYVGMPVGHFVGVYTYTLDGALTYIGSAPNNGNLVCWLVTNAAGTLLFTSETGTGTVTSYSLAKRTKPVMHQQLTLSGATPAPSNIALDPSEKFLYVLSGQSLHVLNVDAAGTMTETASPVVLPVPADADPLGLAVVQK
jgi:6-phosphogluconolactonase (cycloisomerase 2 family)